MSFKVLHSSKIDADKWNSCVNTYQMDIYNEYHFLNAVCLDNWFGFVWGDYEKILPFYRKKKFGILPYICMPPFCQKFDNRSLTKEEWTLAIKFLKKNNIKIDYAVMDRKGQIDYLERFNFVLEKRQLGMDLIKLQYSSLLRKNIEKAQLYLEVKQSIDEAKLSDFYQHLLGFQKLVLSKYSSQFEKLRVNLLAGLYAYDKKSKILISMVLYAKFGAKTYILFPYTTQEGKKKQAMSFLINALIESSDIEIIDFEGSSIKSIANFYAQFGAESQSYWSIHWKRPFLPI